MMMNSQFVIEHADHLADRMLADHSDLSEQLASAWKRCFGRPIADSVLLQLMEFVERQRAVFQSQDEKRTPAAVERLALAQEAIDPHARL